MPAGLIQGLNRFKPAGGFYLPTLLWQYLNEPEIAFSGTIRFPLQRAIRSFLLRGSSSSWGQSTNIRKILNCYERAR